jgi:hypothetical protein
MGTLNNNDVAVAADSGTLNGLDLYASLAAVRD